MEPKGSQNKEAVGTTFKSTSSSACWSQNSDRWHSWDYLLFFFSFSLPLTSNRLTINCSSSSKILFLSTAMETLGEENWREALHQRTLCTRVLQHMPRHYKSTGSTHIPETAFARRNQQVLTANFWNTSFKWYVFLSSSQRRQLSLQNCYHGYDTLQHPTIRACTELGKFGCDCAMSCSIEVR